MKTPNNSGEQETGKDYKTINEQEISLIRPDEKYLDT